LYGLRDRHHFEEDAMFQPIKLSFVIAAFSLMGACAPPANQNDSGSDDASAQDATPEDSTPADTGPSCVSTVPPDNSPFCAMTGCPFAPVSLPQCDGTGNYDFYGPDYCQSTATVMVISAGWCVPCQMEAPMIQSLITEDFADRGVRVITVYAQNPDGSTPDDTNCTHWKNQFHLTSHMLRDPNGDTQRYVPMNAFPSNVIIDQNGNIYDVLYGTERGLSTMVSDVEAVVSAQGR
jgi:thiol-disulfide isomerase/thioredoxin